MTTKIFKFSLKIILCFTLLFSFENVYAASKWIVAAEPFVLANNKDNEVLKSCSVVLPSLILEFLNENVQRRLASQEILDRKLYDFQKERISLFLQLSNEVKSRDVIFLNDYSKSKLKRKLKESDKKIKDIEEKIAQNLKEVEKVKKEYEKKISEEQKISEGDKANYFKNFFGKYESPVIEDISIYQSDPQKLYTDLKSDLDSDYTISETVNKLVSANINCLITGKITSYGDFLSVAVTLYNYPGGKVIGHAVDVASFSDLNSLAQNISSIINPKLSDSIPISVSISVEPEEIKNNVRILIDDAVYTKSFENIVLSSGIHTLHFSLDGYKDLTASYHFKGNARYSINVQMQKIQEGSVSLRFLKPYEGDIFTNGFFSGKISYEQPYSSISINGKNIMGHFINTDGTSADFVIPEKSLIDSAVLKADVKTFDRSEYIDSRRKKMYGSYSVFMISLMPYFFCYGNYNSYAMALKNGSAINIADGNKWQVASNVTGGIAVASGCFFIYELIRYLVAANTVLPVEAKSLSEKQKIKLEEKDRKNLEKIKQKEENQKTEEENFIKNDDEEIESGSETSEIESEKALK